MVCSSLAAYKCFQSTKGALVFLGTWAKYEVPLVPALVQATVTPKSFSHCNVPFWFLTVGLTEQEGIQTAKVRLGSGLVWLGVASRLPRELPGSWSLYLDLVSSVAAVSLSLWACWACVVPLGNSWSKKCLLARASGPSLSLWASLHSRALISARIRNVLC